VLHQGVVGGGLGRQAALAAHALDPMAGPIQPHASPLADALEAIGLAASAFIRRGLRPGPTDPAALAVVLTRGLLIAPPGAK
jgi:hypothetical protein